MRGERSTKKRWAHLLTEKVARDPTEPQQLRGILGACKDLKGV